MTPDELSEKLDSVSLRYELEQQLVGDEPAVQQWWVRAVVQDWERVDDRGEPAEVVVALVHIVKGSLLDPSLWDQLDALQADLEAVASAVLDQEVGGLKEEVESDLLGSGGSLLILNSATLSNDWRGYGVGALLVGMALQVLGDDAACIATYPAPLDGSQGRSRAEAISKLEKVWTQLGFEPVGGGVWILDPAAIAFENAVQALKARFRLA